MAADFEHTAIERRIELFLVCLGVAMATTAGAIWGMRAAEGLAAGSALSWLNFRWLKQGAAGLTRLGLAQAGLDNVRVPRKVHAKFLGRLALLVLGAYVMLAKLHWPAAAVLIGVAAVVPAILVELGYELAVGLHHSNVS